MDTLAAFFCTNPISGKRTDLPPLPSRRSALPFTLILSQREKGRPQSRMASGCLVVAPGFFLESLVSTLGPDGPASRTSLIANCPNQKEAPCSLVTHLGSTFVGGL